MSCSRAAGNSNKGAQSAHKNASNKNKGGVLGRAPLVLHYSMPRSGILEPWVPQKGGVTGNLGSPEKLIRNSINCLKYNIK